MSARAPFVAGSACVASLTDDELRRLARFILNDANGDGTLVVTAEDDGTAAFRALGDLVEPELVERLLLTIDGRDALLAAAREQLAAARSSLPPARERSAIAEVVSYAVDRGFVGRSPTTLSRALAAVARWFPPRGASSTAAAEADP